MSFFCEGFYVFIHLKIDLLIQVYFVIASVLTCYTSICSCVLNGGQRQDNIYRTYLNLLFINYILYFFCEYWICVEIIVVLM